jgi:L-Ala-D/L-Glu epimerase
MRVESVTLTPVTLPLAKALALLGGSTPSFTNVLVTVRTSDGVTGFGEATPRPKLNGETVRSVLEAVENSLAPQLVGREINGHRGITAALGGLVGNACAKAAVEAAALDALARGLNVSCHTLLGGYATMVRCSGLLPLGDPVDVVKTAETMRDRYGISAFKLKVGADLARDIATARLLRREFPQAVLLADANSGYRPPDALAFIKVAEAERIAMIEEPVSHPNPEVRRRITGSTFVDVVGDESCTTTAQAIDALDSGQVSGVSIKTGRTGLADSALIRDRAERLGARVQIGYELVSSVGAAASLAFACASASSSIHPTEGISFLEVSSDLVSAPVEVRDGQLKVPPGPGFGLDIDPERVRELTAG